MSSRFLKLKENHPTLIKLEQIFSLMEELQISFDFSNVGMRVTDQSQERFTFFYMEDLEDDHSPMSNLPPTFEYKVLADNPKFLEEQELATKQRLEQALKKREEAALKEAEAKKQEKILHLAERKAAAVSLEKQIKDLEKELGNE
jgi:hypothetical protein